MPRLPRNNDLRIPRMFPHVYRFAKDTSASSTPEYVIVASVILCAVLSVGAVVGDRSNVFSRLVTLNSVESDIATEGPGTFADDSVAARDKDESPLDEHRSMAVVIVVTAQALLVLAFIFYMLKRKRGVAVSEQRIISSAERHAKQANRLLRMLREHGSSLTKWDLLVEHVMCREIATLGATARIPEIEGALEESMHGVVVIADKSRKMIGLIERQQLAGAPATLADKIMNSIPVSVDHKMRLASALPLMLESGCSILPVTLDGVACGVISKVEVMIALQAMLQFLREVHEEHKQAMLRTLSPDALHEIPGAEVSQQL